MIYKDGFNKNGSFTEFNDFDDEDLQNIHRIFSAVQDLEYEMNPLTKKFAHIPEFKRAQSLLKDVKTLLNKVYVEVY